MARLHYVTNMSVDGYIEDAHGAFDWTDPSDEYFAWITEVVRPFGTWLYGRRLYESMQVWETDPALAARSELLADFANVWQSAEKIVYSSTLDAVVTQRTRLERRFDPDVVRELVSTASADLSIGGAAIAASALREGLVDECHLFVHPVFVGAGKAALATDALVHLELQEERRFDNGVVYLRYQVAVGGR